MYIKEIHENIKIGVPDLYTQLRDQRPGKIMEIETKEK